MVVHLKTLRGPNTGETVTLGQGDRILVGRGDEATLSIDDDELSRRHFQVSWNGTACRLVDLNSRNGTKVNDSTVSSVALDSGDTIAAGNTVFQIEIAEASQQDDVRHLRASGDVLPVAATFRPTPILQTVERTVTDQRTVEPTTGSVLHTLMHGLGRHADTQLYAVVDGAQHFQLAFNARRMGSDLYTLFSGEQSTKLAYVGPVLVTLDEAMPFLEEWVEQLGANAGVLFQTTAELDVVCAHLRDIFIVTDEAGQEYFFRFYDPRILRAFLPTCTGTELREFFAPVVRWICEDEAATGYHAYELDAARLSVSELTN